MSNSQAFDLKQLQEAAEQAPPPPEPVFVKASDGVELAVRVFSPKQHKPRGILIFYHGGGAHSGAGYPLLAHGLAADYGIQVFTPDLRGHGESKGPRGDSPSKEQMYEDVYTMIDFARKETGDQIPLYLGGHSSGAGLMIQYATQGSHTDIHGYVLLSPQLGPNANVARKSSPGFARVSILPFILNGIFGIMGHSPAVKFNYDAETIEKDGVIGFNTVNMANAISPTNPADQLKAMKATNAMELWMGEKDEIFDAEKVKDLYPDTQIVPNATHLGILVEIHKLVGTWISNQMDKNGEKH